MVVNIGNEKGDLIMTKPTVTQADRDAFASVYEDHAPNSPQQRSGTMDDIEKKALEFVNEVNGTEYTTIFEAYSPDLWEALRRAIEQHEALREEVSDTIERAKEQGNFGELYHLILPKPVDPLVEIVQSKGFSAGTAKALREAIESRGGRILFEGVGG